nr:hypothetical protein [Kiritimatiellia bacterium]
ILERTNSFGEVVQQRFTLRVGEAPAATHAEWIANFPSVGSLTDPDDDPDGDGFVNRMENVLGTHPNHVTEGLYLYRGSHIRHSSNPLHDPNLDPGYQWSTDLGTWQPSGAVHNGTPIHIAPRIVEDNETPVPDLIELDISPAAPTPFFLRLAIP